MKVKIGYTITTLPKDAISSYMANVLTHNSSLLNAEKDFKKIFSKYKEFCLSFLKSNKNFILELGNEEWIKEISKYQEEQRELFSREVIFEFSDGSVWSVILLDILKLKLMKEPQMKIDQHKILSEPNNLILWAQKNIDWDDIRSFAKLKEMKNSSVNYNIEWPTAKIELSRYKNDNKD